MKNHARGTFEVLMTPQSQPDKAVGATLNRMSLDKQFLGDLVAIGKGEVLTAVTEMKGSAGYVALERVTGILQGRNGSFVFQHSGIMNRDAQQLSVTVVPDSGTDQLVGLSGQFQIKIIDGKHFYEFDYSLPE